VCDGGSGDATTNHNDVVDRWFASAEGMSNLQDQLQKTGGIDQLP
jgi:hypothetical protein